MKGEPSISGKKIVAKRVIKARGIWGREVFQDGLDSANAIWQY